MAIEIWLPERFWLDHCDRDLPSGELIKSGPKGVKVRCTKDELTEIYNDAVHYSDCVGWSNDKGLLGLQSSAIATQKRIDTHNRRVALQ